VTRISPGVSLLLVVAAVAAPRPARAHGGEDHGADAKAAAAAPAPAPALAEASATTDLFELLVKIPAGATPGEETQLDLYLSDAASNAPIAGASLDVEATGARTFAAAATATDRPGIYRLAVTLPEYATYGLVATVKVKDTQDLLGIGGLVFAPAPTAPAAPPRPAAVWPWILGGAGALVLAALAAIFVRARRRRRASGSAAAGPGTPPAALIALAALAATLLGAPPAARAHGGEDHAAEAAAKAPAPGATPPGAPVYLAKEAQFLLGVRTIRLAARDLPTTLSVLGEVAARTDGDAALYAPFTGRLLAPEGKGLVRPGATVKKGDVLAVVEGILGAPDRVGLATDAAAVESRVGAARARAELARRELDRVKGLAGVLPKKRLDEAEAESAAADAELAATLRERVVLTTAAGLNRHVVKAPIDGIVVAMEAAPGEVVDPGKRLFRVVDTSTLWVTGKVYESDIAVVERAIRATVLLDAYPGRSFDAKLVTFGSVVDATTRTLDAIFEVPNPDGALRIGMFASIAIETGAPAKGLAVPAAALLDRDGRPALFVKLGPEDFVLRPVRAGRRIGRDVEIVAGVAPGDRLVTEGLFPLKSAAPRPAAER
jgi:cobalt-zinc-cadmium efflux system membrane fusion protein